MIREGSGSQTFNSANSNTGGLCRWCWFAGLGCLSLGAELDNTFLCRFVRLGSLLADGEEGGADQLVTGTLGLGDLEAFQVGQRFALQMKNNIRISHSKLNWCELPSLSFRYVWPMKWLPICQRLWHHPKPIVQLCR